MEENNTRPTMADENVNPSVADTTSPRVRIVTITFNPGEEFERFIATVPSATREAWELVIVDNGTEGERVDRLASSVGARVIRTGENLGYGKAANLGARGFAGDWILVANPDVEFTPGCVDRLIAAAHQWPRGGVFGPLIRTPEGEVYPSARRFPRLIAGAGHALLTHVWENNPFSAHYKSETATQGALDKQARAVDWLSGAFLLLRRRAFEQVGGFDDRYLMFFEDTQLGEDLRRASWQSVYVPEAEVLHEQGASWKARPARMIRAHHASALAYLNGVYSAPWQAPLRVLLRVGLACRRELQVAIASK